MPLPRKGIGLCALCKAISGALVPMITMLLLQPTVAVQVASAQVASMQVASNRVLHLNPNNAQYNNQYKNQYKNQYNDQYELGLWFDVLEDKSNLLTIHDLSEPSIIRRFQPSQQESPNYGTSSSAFWLRFTLHNASEAQQHWILESRYPLLDTMECYTPDKNNYRVRTLGDAVPFAARELPYRTCLFRISLQPNETQTIYLRAVSSGPVITPCTLYTAEALLRKEYTERVLQGGFFGIMAIMLAYNLFLFFGVRELSYLYYVLYLGSFIVYQMVLDGSALEYLWPASPLWANKAYPFFASITAGLAIAFARSFLETAHFRSKLWDRMMVAQMAIAAAIACGVFLVPYRVIFTIMSAFVAVSCVLTMLTAIVAVVTGSKSARYFLTGWAVFLAAIFFLATISFGLVPFTFTIWHLGRIGAALEVALLSLGLAYRVNILREEKEKAEILRHANAELSTLNTTLAERNQELQSLNEQLDEANDFKTKMLAMASHDMKNPLGTILSCAHLLKQSLPRDYPDADLVDDVHTSAEGMLKLVRDLLDNSAIELGKLQLQYNTMAWSHLVLGITERYQLAASKKGQMVDVSGIEPCMTIGDEERLQQVVDNLLSNAVKYSRVDGTIVVRLFVRGQMTVLEVQDDGPGFTNDDKEKLFGHFQRLSAKPTGGEHSSGVGLSIVKKIIELHSGTITIRTELGKGSTFVVELPAVSLATPEQMWAE
jgi:signal transduction histidine kinase